MIKITLLPNKECQYDCPSELQTLGSDFLIISGEAGVTEFRVCYPETIKNWAKRVDVVNARGEYESIEFEGYKSQVTDKLEFDFSLPSSATKYKGYAKIIFKATKDGRVFIWQPEPIPVTGETQCDVPATGNQDLLSAAYETAQAANAKSDSALSIAEEAKGASARAESFASDALSKTNALVQEPDCTEANGEGEARVDITADGRLKFVNIKGFMPVIQIGDVQAVSPDKMPEVVIREGSSPQNPILDMKLPSGRQGEKGESVSAGMQSIPIYVEDWTQNDEHGYILRITADKHGLGETNKIVVDVNPYAPDGTVYSTYDSPSKTADGTITITSQVPWEGMVFCAAGIAEGQDIVARQNIAAHKADAVAHITAVERETWNSKETPEAAQRKADSAVEAAKTYADGKVAELVGTAPEALDTLKELAEALKNDPNHTETMLTEIGKKTDKAVFENHTENDSNPHRVTAKQVGAATVDQGLLAESALPKSGGALTGNVEIYGNGLVNNGGRYVIRNTKSTGNGGNDAENNECYIGNAMDGVHVDTERFYQNITGTDYEVFTKYNLVAGDNIVLSRNANTGKTSISASFGTVAPYKITINTADWSGSASIGYTYSISDFTHGKGADPVVEIYNANRQQVYDSPTVDEAGNVTLHSRAQETLFIKIR